MKKFFILPLLAFLAVSCASNTNKLTKRIEEKPQAFEKLSSRHKALVESGKIEEGMRPDAVYLAWGNPASKSEGQEKGRTFEKWTYTSLAPVFNQSLNVGFGHGFRGRSRRGGFGHGDFGRSSRHGRGGFGRGGFGRGGFGHGGFGHGGFGSSVSYVPVRSAWVKFRNGRVDSWQRGKKK